MFLCGRFNGVKERILESNKNKQVCKSLHLSAVIKKAFPVVQPFGCAIICTLSHVSSCFCWLGLASLLSWTDFHWQQFSNVLVVFFFSVTVTGMNHHRWEHPDIPEALNLKNTNFLVFFFFSEEFWNNLIIFDHFQILNRAYLFPAYFQALSLPVCATLSFFSLSEFYFPGDHCAPALRSGPMTPVLINSPFTLTMCDLKAGNNGP